VPIHQLEETPAACDAAGAFCLVWLACCVLSVAADFHWLFGMFQRGAKWDVH
jgi:hypothetical protein